MTYQERIGEALIDKWTRNGEAVSFTFHNGRRIPIIRGGMPMSDNLPARLSEWAGVGTTYYLDPVNGLDSRTETQAKSISTPWQTMMKFKTSYVKPATGHIRVLMRGGAYRATGSATATQATLEMWGLGARAPDSTHLIIFEAYPGETPVVEEPAYTGSTPELSERHAIWLDDATASWCRFRGLELGINTPSCTQHQGFRIDDNVTNVEIDKCNIHHWRSASTTALDKSQGIFCQGDNIHFYNTNFHEIGDNAVEANGASHGIYFSSGSANCVIVNCISRDNRNGFGFQYFSGGTGGTGHILTHCTITNNLMSGIVVDGIWTVDVRNCIIYSNTEWGVTLRNGGICICRYNLTNGNQAGNQTDGYELGTGGGTFTISNKIITAPNFVNYASKNYHLNTGSPAYNAGLIEYTPTTDYEATSRVVSTLGVYVAPEEVGAVTTDSGTLYLDLQPSGTEFQTGQTTDSGTLLFKLTPSGTELQVAPAGPGPDPIPYVPTLSNKFREFRIIHVNHAYEEIGEVAPSNMHFSLPLSTVGDVSYDMSLDDVMAREEKVYPYKTDYILMLGNKRLQAGMHVGVAIADIEQEVLQVSGNDYLHYLEKRWYPFDPMNLAAGGYIAPIGTDIFALIEALLDRILAEPNSLVITYDNGLSGQVINDFKIELGDTEHIKAKIETLSKKLPGFDFEIDPFREFKMYPDGKGSIRSFTFEQGRNIYLLDYANRGPEATHTLGIVQGQGNKLARAVTHATASTYRRLDGHEDLQIATTDINVVQQMTEAESERNIIPHIEFSAKYVGDDAIADIFDEVETGDRVPVYADLGWTVMDDYMRIVNIQGDPDDEGNLELTFTFDNGTLAQ